MNESKEKVPYIVEVTETFTKRIIVWAQSEDEAFEEAENLCNEEKVDVTDCNGDYDFSRSCEVVGDAIKLLGTTNGYPEYRVGDMEERKTVLANLECWVHHWWLDEVPDDKIEEADIKVDMSDLTNIGLPAREVEGKDGKSYCIRGVVNAEENTITVFIMATPVFVLHADSTGSLNQFLEWNGPDEIYDMDNAEDKWAAFFGKGVVPEEYIE